MLVTEKISFVTTVVRTVMTLHNLREFNQSDWYGYAWCIDDFGTPETFEMEFSPSESCKFVADDNGIGLDHFVNGDPTVYAFENPVPGYAPHYLIRGIYEEIRAGAENYTTWRDVLVLVEKLGFRQV